jgi:glycosyltransferase involved in cell wall biosynthesis
MTQKETFKPRVAIVVSHPIQHFCPLYEALSSDGRLDITVVFGSLKGLEDYFDRDFARVVNWGYGAIGGFKWQVLGASEGRSYSSFYRTVQAVARALRGLKPDAVVVYGYSDRRSLAAALWAKVNGAKVLAIGDSELLHKRGFTKRCLKQMVVRLWLRCVDTVLTCGDQNELYYQHYGFSRPRMTRSPIPIDEERYRTALERAPAHRQELRRRLGIPADAILCLNVGKMVSWKGQADLIRALAATAYANLWLCLVGDGPDRQRLEGLAAALQIRRRVVFAGFVKPTDLPPYYIASDLYVHPSLVDHHPLSITEAIFCGLPVITSDRVGSVGETDDVQAGRNGWVVPAGNWRRLAEMLSDVAARPEILNDASQCSLRISRQRAMAVSVDGFVRGVFLALRVTAPGTSGSRDATAVSPELR